jgi:hypothetical protein
MFRAKVRRFAHRLMQSRKADRQVFLAMYTNLSSKSETLTNPARPAMRVLSRSSRDVCRRISINYWLKLTR